MSLFTRTRDPHAAAAEAQARLELARISAQFDREQREADAQERRRVQAERSAEREQRRVERRERQAEFWAKARTVAPLILINAGAAYAQALFAYEDVAPDHWNVASKVAFAIAFSAALESISIYVQWHAHDALMLKAYATAARLRRAAWTIAAVVGAINYSHFAGAALAPTAAAISFGLLSLLSPWLWGLHTRRAQHVQLLAEDAEALDLAGAEFSMARRRAFPIRSWAARRWSIDHGVTHPQRAWDGYKAEREARRAVVPNRLVVAWRILRGDAPAQPEATHLAESYESIETDVPITWTEPTTVPLAESGPTGEDAPEKTITAGQKVRQDVRETHEIYAVVRALNAANPTLSRRRLAALALTSEKVVRNALGPANAAPVSGPPADTDAPEGASETVAA